MELCFLMPSLLQEVSIAGILFYLTSHIILHREFIVFDDTSLTLDKSNR